MKISLEELQEIIKKRAKSNDPESWTAKLVESGIEGTTKKFGEEAVETIIAVCNESKTRTRDEAADLLYHLLVMLYTKGVRIEDVLKELKKRTSVSGVKEKKLRKKIIKKSKKPKTPKK